MVVAYSIMGGFLFQALEFPHEIDVKKDITAFKEELIEEIRAMVEPSVLMRDVNLTNFTQNVGTIHV